MAKSRTIRAVKRQTGSRKSRFRDKVRTALAPGLRISKTGKTYWETRKNRSDVKGGL